MAIDVKVHIIDNVGTYTFAPIWNVEVCLKISIVLETCYANFFNGIIILFVAASTFFSSLILFGIRCNNLGYHFITKCDSLI